MPYRNIPLFSLASPLYTCFPLLFYIYTYSLDYTREDETLWISLRHTLPIAHSSCSSSTYPSAALVILSLYFSFFPFSPFPFSSFPSPTSNSSPFFFPLRCSSSNNLNGNRIVRTRQSGTLDNNARK